MQRQATAFANTTCVACGDLVDVALAAQSVLAADSRSSVLVFDDESGAVIDLDLRGSPAELVARMGAAGKAAASGDQPEMDGEKPRGRGRPKLGVVSREISLLPRHWEWLAQQPGGASQTIRRLVDEARRRDGGKGDVRQAREAAYKFMSAIAGDLAGFEEATRALFAGDRPRFQKHASDWPADIRAHAERIGWRYEDISGGKHSK